MYEPQNKMQSDIMKLTHNKRGEGCGPRGVTAEKKEEEKEGEGGRKEGEGKQGVGEGEVGRQGPGGEGEEEGKMETSQFKEEERGGRGGRERKRNSLGAPREGYLGLCPNLISTPQKKVCMEWIRGVEAGDGNGAQNTSQLLDPLCG